MLNFMQPSQAVVAGRDGWLFLAGGAHGPLSFALGKKKPSEESYLNFHKNLRRRISSAKRIDASFIHLIVPDKHVVCSDVFPEKLLFSLSESYKAMLGLSPVSRHLLAPVDDLTTIWEKAYYKQDTHLTPFGTLALSACMLQHLDTLYPSRHVLPSESDFRDMHSAIGIIDDAWTGDLGSKVNPPIAGPRYALNNDRSIYRFKNNFAGGSNGIADIYINMQHSLSHERILIFGDSFGRELAHVLAGSFFQVVFLRTPFYHPEIAAQIQPTIVITEHVERYLSNVSLDDARPNFLLYPFLKDLAYRPSAEFAKAFSAILSYGRPPYDSFIEGLE